MFLTKSRKSCGPSFGNTWITVSPPSRIKFEECVAITSIIRTPLVLETLETWDIGRVEHAVSRSHRRQHALGPMLKLSTQQILMFWQDISESERECLTMKPICDLVTRCESIFWEVSLRMFCDRVKPHTENSPQEAIGYLLTYVAAAIPDDVPQRICNMGIGLTNLMRISTKSFHRDTHDDFLRDRERVSQKAGALLSPSSELDEGHRNRR